MGEPLQHILTSQGGFGRGPVADAGDRPRYLATPFYGSRRMRAWLNRQGFPVSRKRVQRLMRVMGFRAIYRSPKTSRPTPQRRVYPYQLGKAKITRPNQVWAADITYLPMARGFLYLVAVMEWYSRYVVS